MTDGDGITPVRHGSGTNAGEAAIRFAGPSHKTASKTLRGGVFAVVVAGEYWNEVSLGLVCVMEVMRESIAST